MTQQKLEENYTIYSSKNDEPFVASMSGILNILKCGVIKQVLGGNKIEGQVVLTNGSIILQNCLVSAIINLKWRGLKDR